MKLSELIYLTIIFTILMFFVSKDILTTIGGTLILWLSLGIRLILDEDNLRN